MTTPLTPPEGPHKTTLLEGAEREVTVPVVAEVATFGKRSIDTGRGVRVTKRIVEREEIVDEPLEHDELLVERVTVDRFVDPDNPPSVRQEGDVTIIPVLEEVVVTEKRTLLKEELRITRRRREVHVPQRVVLRSEVVTTEEFDENRTSSRPAPNAPAEPTASDPAGES